MEHYQLAVEAAPNAIIMGQIVKWIGTCTDIDDHKQVNQELAHRVAVRTSELKQSLAEKETLLKEIHHRVKNNLQIISSLLRMQGESLITRSAAAVLEQSRQRVLSKALIHERLYGSHQMDGIDFGEYAEILVHELFRSLAARPPLVTSRLKLCKVFLSIDQAIPCGLILNELLTNAIKHAYPDGRSGEVSIELTETPSREVTLMVSDTGVGLPQDFDWTKSKSLGLPVVQGLIKQLGGTLHVDRQSGVSFVVRFQRGSTKGDSP